ncbi:hypothetical protein ACI78V_16270 [Geodermatophilus sp. SYSU D00742]
MTDAAARFAEAIQRHEYALHGIPLPRKEYYYSESFVRTLMGQRGQRWVQTDAEFEAMVTEYVARTRETSSNCSRYEHPERYAEMLDIAEVVYFTAHGVFRNQQLPKWPLVATLPRGELNAVTMRAPGSDQCVIFFYADLLSFLKQLCGAIALAMPMQTDPENHRSRILDDRDSIAAKVAAESCAMERFADLLVKYASRGALTMLNIPNDAVAWPHNAIANDLYLAMEMFIFGHEYGHVFEGHFDDPQTPVKGLHGVDAEELEYDWTQEYYADAHGVALAMRSLSANRYDDYSVRFAGVVAFFTAMEMFERGRALLSSGDENRVEWGSHPPAANRRRYICNTVLPALIADESMRAHALRRGDALSTAVSLLWQQTRPFLAQLREQGLRLGG